MTIKISLLQGTPPNLIGGGAIQKEYDIWAQNTPDVDLKHFIISETSEYLEKLEAHGRILHNVRTFNYDSNLIDELEENLIVLCLPSPNEFNSKSDELKAKDYYFNLFAAHKDKFKEKSNITLVCYDYKKEVVLDNLAAVYPTILDNIDRLWVNNKNNPLVEHLKENNFNSFYFGCPQFIAEEEVTWKTVEEKLLNQLYYQGRNLDWKGWKHLVPLKDELQKVNLEVNMTFNGFINSSDLYVNTEFDSLYNRGFSEKILNEPEFFGGYSPTSSKELTQQAGFVTYFTDLPNDTNFFPEYALIDALRAGTVIIMPSWYYLPYENPIFNVKPEDAGVLTWDPKDSNSTKELAQKIKELQSDFNKYNEYRKRALQFAYENYGATKTILKAIGVKNGN